MRLMHLYLRSRLAGWSTVVLAASGAIAWFLLWRIVESGITAADVPEAIALPLIVIPLLPAVVIGVSTRSPFGDTELSVSRSLPLLRFIHLAGLLTGGVIALALAANAWIFDSIEWELVRNLAGYTGLALIGARLLGSGLSWVVPLGYGVIAFMLTATDPKSRWAWPGEWPLDRWSVTVAMVLIVVGLLTVTLQAERDTGDDVP